MIYINLNATSKMKWPGRAKKLIPSIQQIAERVYSLEKISLQKVHVSISLVGGMFIKRLNHQYRKKNQVTDVLSFPLEKEQQNPLALKNQLQKVQCSKMQEYWLGDIFINVIQAEKQAKNMNHSLKRELVFLTVHGLYHLLGYDHLLKKDKLKMRAKEKKAIGSYQ